jgi:hypothetical protein
VGKGIAHLTYHQATRKEKQWLVSDVLYALGTLIAKFAEHAPPYALPAEYRQQLKDASKPPPTQVGQHEMLCTDADVFDSKPRAE